MRIHPLPIDSGRSEADRSLPIDLFPRNTLRRSASPPRSFSRKFRLIATKKKTRGGSSRYTFFLLLEASLEPFRACKDSRNKLTAHFCRTRRPGRFFCRGMRIRRAGYGPHRRPAGDKRIGHHPTGRVRRCFTIEKASPTAEKGEPYDGPGDLGCSEAPSSGLSSPWQALRGRVAMPRRSLLVIYLRFGKFQKSDRRSFQRRLPASENLCDSWNANMWKE